MAYCTLDNIKAQLDEQDIIDLTDDKDLGVIDQTIVDQAIADADAAIDSYLGEKYVVPLNPVPDIARKLSVDIAVYNLYSRRGRVTDTTEKRYDDAVKILRDVLKSGAGIPGAVKAEGPARDSFVKLSSSGRIFSRNSMKGF